MKAPPACNQMRQPSENKVNAQCQAEASEQPQNQTSEAVSQASPRTAVPTPVQNSTSPPASIHVDVRRRRHVNFARMAKTCLLASLLLLAMIVWSGSMLVIWNSPSRFVNMAADIPSKDRVLDPSELAKVSLDVPITTSDRVVDLLDKVFTLKVQAQRINASSFWIPELAQNFNENANHESDLGAACSRSEQSAEAVANLTRDIAFFSEFHDTYSSYVTNFIHSVENDDILTNTFRFIWEDVVFRAMEDEMKSRLHLFTLGFGHSKDPNRALPAFIVQLHATLRKLSDRSKVAAQLVAKLGSASMQVLSHTAICNDRAWLQQVAKPQDQLLEKDGRVIDALVKVSRGTRQQLLLYPQVLKHAESELISFHDEVVHVLGYLEHLLNEIQHDHDNVFRDLGWKLESHHNQAVRDAWVRAEVAAAMGSKEEQTVWSDALNIFWATTDEIDRSNSLTTHAYCISLWSLGTIGACAMGLFAG